MGDSLETARLVFYCEPLTDLGFERLWKRIRLIAMEHQYERLNIHMYPNNGNMQSVNFSFNVPDSDGDRDGFHDCALRVFFDRVRWLVRAFLLGHDEGQW